MSESVSSGVARRARIIQSIQSETGIDEVMIEQLVRRFYERVRADAALGPIFSARIADWEHHLQRMCASVALVVKLPSSVAHPSAGARSVGSSPL